MTNLIKVPVCPVCGQEEYYYSICLKCDSRPKIVLQEREKKITSGDWEITGYASTKTNAEIVLRNVKTHEEVNVSLNQFFKMIKWMKFDNLTLRERKQGNAYSWEILNKGDKDD
jgi:hypothetical protein